MLCFIALTAIRLTAHPVNSALQLHYRTEPFNESDIKIVLDKPFEYNRIVPIEYFNSLDEKLYSLASPDLREAVIIFNQKTKITQEDTVEYFI